MSTETVPSTPTPTHTYDTNRPVVSPRVDIYENADAIRLVADVPGTRDADVRVTLDKQELTLEADVPPIGEFRAFRYRRVFLVSRGIDPDRVSAELKAGVLTVHLPKRDELKPRRIHVGTA